MDSAKLLIIEDDRPLATLLAERFLSLEGKNYQIKVAHDGSEGLRTALTWQPDLLLLDLDLPGLPGLAVLQAIRNQEPEIRVCILTGAIALSDRLDGFSAGTDDYITKPFHCSELVARVEAILRRGRLPVCTEISFNSGRQEVTCDGQIYRLTVREAALFGCLFENPGQVFTRKVLLDTVWDGKACYPNVVDVYIRRLRKIIGSRYIKTAHGRGYFFDKKLS